MILSKHQSFLLVLWTTLNIIAKTSSWVISPSPKQPLQEKLDTTATNTIDNLASAPFSIPMTKSLGAWKQNLRIKPSVFQQLHKQLSEARQAPSIFSKTSTAAISCSDKAPSSSSWSHSIGGDDIACTYMPFWDWQQQHFSEQLTNLIELVIPSSSSAATSSSDQQQGISLSLLEGKSTRVQTKWFSSDEYRLIRMTYMDGGSSSQIMTTVCYPRGNLPIMGHGLLQCGDRIITISDFQPLEEAHSDIAKDCLKPIQGDYPSLQQPMSDRYFDRDQYWSDYTLLGRFPKPDNDATKDSNNPIWSTVFPAYQKCVEAHVQLCKEQQQEQHRHKTNIIAKTQELLQRHADYDTHVASRDPAIRMLSSIFGAKTAHDLVYKVLFPLAVSPETTTTTTTTVRSTPSAEQ